MQISGRGVSQVEDTWMADLHGQHLQKACLKHREEAPVAGVETVRGDEGREVMGMTGLFVPFGPLLF